MQISLSKHKRDGKYKIITVWSPISAGKTIAAVNLSAVMAETVPTALVDLSPDGAAYAYLNCRGTQSLKSLVLGDPENHYAPVIAQGLKAYVFEPGDKSPYNGDASILSIITKSLTECHIVFDAPSDRLKASNALLLADTVLLVVDYNIHGVLLARKHLSLIRKPVLLVNRYQGRHICFSPEETLNLKAYYLPDSPENIYKSIFAGVPVIKQNEEFKSVFQKIKDEILQGGA